MRTKRTTLLALLSGGLLFGIGTAVLADARYEGTYTLRRWGMGGGLTVKLWVKKEGESLRVVRKAEYPDGRKTLHAQGKVSILNGGWLRVKFYDPASLTDTLDNLGASPQAKQVARAVYRISPSGNVIGAFVGEDASGNSYRIYERGRKTQNEPEPGDSGGSDGNDGDDNDNDGNDNDGNDNDGNDNDSATVKVVSPAAGTALAGQSLSLELRPAGAELTIEGPAERSGDTLKLTGAGEVKLTAKSGSNTSEPVTIKAVQAEVVEVSVDGAIRLRDARAPHFKRELGSDEDGESVPAAILAGQKLKLKIKLQAEANLSKEARVTITASAAGSDVTFEEEVRLRRLENGQQVELESEGPLNTVVAINALELSVSVGGQELAQKARLRVYTGFKAPIKNIDRDPQPAATALHFEKACGWANGASKNIGNGDDSIGYQVDNRMRHYVHLETEGLGHLRGAKVPVADYAEGAEAPVNYKDLRGWVDRTTGQRRIRSLYYPPLEPTQPYQEYENYRNNFGWHVLDNPRYTGGRCNQQASLVCGILGTLGIKGRILYLHRYGRGKQSGRAVRQYFYSNDSWPSQSSTGGGPWNFHGVALMTLGDGSEWIYDGSFSSPPNRKNGTREWAENAGGPFVHSWGPWLYDDGSGGRVPANDIPNNWRGIQKADGE